MPNKIFSTLLALFIALVSAAQQGPLVPAGIGMVTDAYPQCSPGGDLLLFQSNRNGNWDIYSMKIDGSSLTRLTSSDLNEVTPKWSPDGKRIVYCIDVDSINSDIYIMDANGRNNKRLTTFIGDDSHPNWSPDGKRIIYNSAQNTPDIKVPWPKQHIEIFTMNADGSDKKQISQLKTISTYPSFSPDGKLITFRAVTDGASLRWDLSTSERNSEIFVMNADGTGARNVSNHAAYDGWPCWSPDGKQILFSSNRTGPANIGQLYVVNPDGTGCRQITNGPGSFVQASWRNNRIVAHQHWEKEDFGFVSVMEVR